MLTLPGVSTLAKELTVTTRVMQSSSYELNTSVSVSVECKTKRKLKHMR